MTKLIQQLNFSSSNYYDVAGVLIEPNAAKTKKYCGDDSSLSSSLAGSKRSALSASDAECFSLCLGAGPLCIKKSSFLGGPDVPAHDTAPPGGVGSGASSPASPSTPTHDDNNRDLLSTLLWSSASSLSNSEESLVSDAHPPVAPEQQEAIIRKILERKDAKAVKIDLKIYLTENTLTRWEAVVKGNTMYLRVPGVLQSGSKDSFMLLLDFAEEKLRCSNCIICVLKTRADRATLLRTFMFMGFQLLPPNSPLAADIANPAYMFLHYNMQ